MNRYKEAFINLVTVDKVICHKSNPMIPLSEYQGFNFYDTNKVF